jgi:hypothetical protein
MGFSQYNKGRPFLVVTRISSPAEGEKTSKKDWGKDGKWEHSEMITIEDSIKNKHMCEATVIVDILKRKLVKSRFADAEDKEVVDYYLNTYKQHVAEGVAIWMQGNYEDKDAAKKFLNDIEDELKNIPDTPINVVSE